MLRPTLEDVRRTDEDRGSNSEYLATLLTVLSDDQLARLAGLEKEDYKWGTFFGPGPRCVAGHVFDLVSVAHHQKTGEGNPSPPIGSQDDELADELSFASCFLSFPTVSTAIENEIYRRAMEYEEHGTLLLDSPTPTEVSV